MTRFAALLCALLLAGPVVSSRLVVAPAVVPQSFPKPAPEEWEAAVKLRAADGSVFRAAREDWEGARRLVAEDREWRAWADARRAALDAWIVRHPSDRAEWPGGRPHGFVSPKDSSTLTWTDAIPGEETDHFFSPSDPRVPLTPENTASWYAGFRDRHVNKLHDAAVFYRLTGHEPYAEWVAGQLDYYAANLHRWATLQPGGPRLCYENLGDAVLLSKFVASARLIFDIAPADRRQAWLDGLFMPTVERLDRTWLVIQNHSVWHRASAAQVGLLFGDEPLLRRALDGEFGLRAQLGQGVTSELPLV